MKLNLSPEDRLTRRAEKLGSYFIGYTADLAALGFAWSLWGWQASALLLCIGISKAAINARHYLLTTE